MRVPPGRASIAAVQDEIVTEMAAFETPLGKYEYLVRVARELEVPADPIRRPEHAVPGCQAQVWIHVELVGERLRIRADSDALITRGIAALLVRVLDDRTPGEILGAELSFLDRTGLGAHLSPARSNGLASMVRHIRQLASSAGGTPEATAPSPADRP